MSLVGFSLLSFLVSLTREGASAEVPRESVSCDRKPYGAEYWGPRSLNDGGNCPVERSIETKVDELGSEMGSSVAMEMNPLETSEVNSTASAKKFLCLSNVTARDEVVTIPSSVFLSSMNTTGNHCYAVLFYARWCRFSAKAAPAFNALSRAIPQLRKFAVDLSEFSPLNSQLGVVGLPTLLFFKNGKVILRFNTTITVDNVADFISYHTDLQPDRTIQLEPADYDGPVPSSVKEMRDFGLVFSVAVVLLVLLRVVLVSRPVRVAGRWIVRQINVN